MKKLLLFIISILSISAWAIPTSITCDKRSVFGLGKLTRVEFEKIGVTDYEMTVYKEKSCGRGTGCMFLDEKFKKVVSLFESPGQRNLLITPGCCENTGDNIKIYTNFKKCKVRIKSEGFRFSGKPISIDGISYLNQ